jgi:hypothetical protein
MRLVIPSVLFPSGISAQTRWSLLSSPMHAKWPSYLIVCDFIACIIFGKGYKPFVKGYKPFGKGYKPFGKGYKPFAKGTNHLVKGTNHDTPQCAFFQSNSTMLSEVSSLVQRAIRESLNADQTLSLSLSLCLCHILNSEKVMHITDFFFFRCCYLAPVMSRGIFGYNCA